MLNYQGYENDGLFSNIIASQHILKRLINCEFLKLKIYDG